MNEWLALLTLKHDWWFEFPYKQNCFRKLNSISMHRSNHGHHHVILIWLNCFWKGCAVTTYNCPYPIQIIVALIIYNLSHVMRKPVYAICKHQRRRSACTSVQSDQHLCCLLPRYYNTSSLYIRNFKPLPSLCGCAGWFEFTLVENPKDRFSHGEAHFSVLHRHGDSLRLITKSIINAYRLSLINSCFWLSLALMHCH